MARKPVVSSEAKLQALVLFENHRTAWTGGDTHHDYKFLYRNPLWCELVGLFYREQCGHCRLLHSFDTSNQGHGKAMVERARIYLSLAKLDAYATLRAWFFFEG